MVWWLTSTDQDLSSRDDTLVMIFQPVASEPGVEQAVRGDTVRFVASTLTSVAISTSELLVADCRTVCRNTCRQSSAKIEGW
jgi:hypothetical protein